MRILKKRPKGTWRAIGWFFIRNVPVPVFSSGRHGEHIAWLKLLHRGNVWILFSPDEVEEVPVIIGEYLMEHQIDPAWLAHQRHAAQRS